MLDGAVFVRSVRYRNICLSLAVAILLVALLVPSEATGATGGTAKLRLSEDYWYFGVLQTAVVVSHDFWIHSVGNDTLRISKVTPGCGCTTAPLSKERIAPGDSARLSVVFDTKNMLGKMVKEVSILSNDAEKPTTVLRFMGVLNSVHPKVKIRPNIIRFFPSAANNNRMQKTLVLTNSFDVAIDLKIVDYPRALVKVSPISTRVKAGESVNIEVEQLIPATTEADALSSLTFEFSGPENERITIPLVNYFKKKL